MRQFFCILCSWIITENESIFCNFCERKLEALIKQPKARMQGKVKHYYLFKWGSSNDQLCRRLIYHLKEKPEAFFRFFGKRYNHLKLLDKTVFICPFSKRKMNHAKSFASTLMKLYLDSSVYEVEAASEAIQPQKRLKRKDRLQKLKGKIYPSLPISNWVFVDDVLVTGSTYYSIYESVGRKPQALFTIFYKELTFENDGECFK